MCVGTPSPKQSSNILCILILCRTSELLLKFSSALLALLLCIYSQEPAQISLPRSLLLQSLLTELILQILPLGIHDTIDTLSLDLI